MKDEFYMVLSQNIKKLRKLNKMTQLDLSKKMYKSPSAIKKYESGKINIPLSVVKQLTDIFDISLLELLGDDAQKFLFNHYDELITILNIDMTVEDIKKVHNEIHELCIEALSPLSSVYDVNLDDILNNIFLENNMIYPTSELLSRTISYKNFAQPYATSFEIIDYLVDILINNPNYFTYILDKFSKELIYIFLILDEITLNDLAPKVFCEIASNKFNTVDEFKNTLICHYLRKYNIFNNSNKVTHDYGNNKLNEINHVEAFLSFQKILNYIKYNSNHRSLKDIDYNLDEEKQLFDKAIKDVELEMIGILFNKYEIEFIEVGDKSNGNQEE